MTKINSVTGLVGLFALALVACGDDSSSGGESKPGSGVTPSGDGRDTGTGTTSPGGSSNEGAPNGNTPTGACVVKSNITQNTTWDPVSCPDGYLVKYMLEVRGDAELHIEPGTVVKLASTASLNVVDSGALVAKGTAAAPIVFDGATVGTPSWGGLRIRSANPLNALAFVVVRHAGTNENEYPAALMVSKDGVASLDSVEISDNALRGLGVYSGGKLTHFDRVAILRNLGGAGHVTVPAVKYLKGVNNTIVDNGLSNSMIVEATSLLKITEDSVWPSLAPAAYRITGQNGANGDILKVEQHLVIEPGAILDFASGSGILVAGGTAGLKAVGMPDQKIVFRGVDGSSWSGITFGESAWSDNRLENVEVRNASCAPSWGYYGTGNSSTRKAGILLGYNAVKPVSAVLKDFVITGPNNAPADVAVKGSSTLGQEGSVTGTGTAGVLEVQAL